MAGTIAAGLMQLSGGSGEGMAALVSGVAPAAGAGGAVATDYMAPWIDTAQCTSCDECTKINPKIFAYNEEKKAYIKDPNGGPYGDIVKSAEECTARVIHPGLPVDRSVKGIDKWIKRAEKYN
jgi:pyruvate-ferredoxin/flavodoxin oxidoreductase